MGNVLGSCFRFSQRREWDCEQTDHIVYPAIFVYTAHKVNVVVVSTNGEYGQRYWVDFLCFTP